MIMHPLELMEFRRIKILCFCFLSEIQTIGMFWNKKMLNAKLQGWMKLYVIKCPSKSIDIATFNILTISDVI